MSDTTTITSANQSGFQQLSSLMAKRGAQQAEELAKTLRRQADAAQAEADKYKEKAQTMDDQATKAQVKSDDLHSRLSLADAFNQGANRLSDTLANATFKTETYSRQGTPSVSNESRPASGNYLDIKA